MKNIKIILILMLISLVGFSSSNAQESANNRKDKNIFVGVKPIGIDVVTLFTTPVTAGYNVNESLFVGGEYGTGLYEQTDGTDTASLALTNMGVYGRWYWGNSFNTLFAVHQRTWDGKFSSEFQSTEIVGSEVITTKAKYDGTIQATALVGTIGIGNQWLLDNGITLGLDWISVASLLSSSTSSTISAGGTVNASTGASVSATLSDTDKAKAEDELAEGAKVFNQISALPGLFNFTIGYSF